MSADVKELRKQRYHCPLAPKAMLEGRVACHHGLAGYCSHRNPLHVCNEGKKLANINHETGNGSLNLTVKITVQEQLQNVEKSLATISMCSQINECSLSKILVS